MAASGRAMLHPVACLVAAAAALLLALASAAQAAPSAIVPSGEMVYGIIVDCGSSGTRVHMYQWDSAYPYPELLHHVQPMRDRLTKKPLTKKIKPGLSSLAEHPEHASNYMQPIVDYVLANLPPNGAERTSVYIMGTAGMRLLDDRTQKEIMNDIASWLKTDYKFTRVTTSVISGATEGAYQFLTVNAQARTFQRPWNPVVAQSYAVIEMGGASSQVTYQLTPATRSMLAGSLGNNREAARAFDQAVVKPELANEVDKLAQLDLVSVTFLGLGSNSARDNYIDRLISVSGRVKHDQYRMQGKLFGVQLDHLRSGRAQLRLHDPCLPTGANQTVTKPMRLFSQMSPDKTCGFVVDEDMNEQTFQLSLTGTGQFDLCRSIQRGMLYAMKRERTNCEPFQPCSLALLGTVFVPFNLLNTFGLSELYYTTMHMLRMPGKYERREMLAKTKEICETSFATLMIQYASSNKDDPTRVLLECFKAVWMDTFLFEGLQMPDWPGFDQFETTAAIHGEDFGWTLGAVLDKSASIDRHQDERDGSSGSS